MTEETTLPVGPQHPALKEPASFELTVDGEEIVDASLALSHNHRGIEQAALSKSYLENIYLLERICGICSHSHTTAFVRAVEDLADVDVPPRARYIRSLVGELERIHSHMLWLGVAGHEIGFETLWQYAWRDREIVLDLLEALTGNRVHYAINTVGGVREDLNDEQREAICDGIADLRERMDFYAATVPEEETVRMRLAGVGTVSTERTRELCAVGPTARASGVDTDVRRDDPYAAYDELDFEVVTDDRGDLLARTVVRIREIQQSIDLIEQVLDRIPEGSIAPDTPIQARTAGLEEGIVTSRYEAPRGELFHFVASDGSDEPDRVHVRVPTLANWPTVVESLRGANLADTPIVVAGIDPCISCTSRIGVDVADGDDYTLDDLREYAFEYYGGGP
ncbi:MAG: nickel-dependent hydrogenase large subunit [Halococcoides sp.]